jgi:hypothetical protein
MFTPEKVTCFSRRCDIAPSTGVRTGSRPASGDEVAVGKDKVDVPLDIRKREPELLGDERLARATRSRLRRPKIVADIVVHEHFLR